MAAIPVPADGKSVFQQWLDLTNLLVAQGAGGMTTSSTIAQAITAVTNELNAH